MFSQKYNEYITPNATTINPIMPKTMESFLNLLCACSTVFLVSQNKIYRAKRHISKPKNIPHSLRKMYEQITVIKPIE